MGTRTPTTPGTTTPRVTLYTLDVDRYSPEVTSLTYPLMRQWAEKIGARFHIIDQRKSPHMPPAYEKLQIFDLARGRADDWAIYLDADALVHPDTPDFTQLIPRDTVAHNAADMAAVRWRYDDYFRRDGRHIGSGNWLAVASSWCLDLWHPLDDLTLQEALQNIRPADFERRAGITPDHLLDDYVLSRNIAKFGLKFTTILEVQKQTGATGEFFRHEYLMPIPEKVVALKKILVDWKLA